MNKSIPIDEKILLQMLQEDNQLAFTLLYRMFQPALVFFANRLLFSQAISEAEEVVQDCFMKFYERRHAFDDLKKVKAFLYIVTKTACFKRIAREKTRKQRYDMYIADFDEADDFILNEIIYTEALRQMKAEIEKLPEKCRAIMDMLVEEDKTPNEIAAELNISVSTVNNQKARAVSILKDKLSGAGLLLLLMQI